uniref:Ribosomal protein L35 n=1 Tax=Rhizochromulina marina TaxID=1034831 RepID=A0A514CPR3_9STRA|nr:ribosomal protein L35 [Rhizochromulina marina]QDH81798.1 ribosomal protein L35 [Rhizochromulina marina]
MRRKVQNKKRHLRQTAKVSAGEIKAINLMLPNK